MVVTEQVEQAKTDRAEWLAEQECRARARFLRCPECGTVDGMEWWDREDFVDCYGPPEPDEKWYAPEETQDGVCRPCWACCGQVPEGYQPMPHEEVLEWLEHGA